MSADMGGNGASAIAEVTAAKLRGKKIWEGWIAVIQGEGAYLYEVEPTATVTGKCTCGGRTKVVTSRGGNYLGTLANGVVEKLALDPGCAERIIIVVPED